MPWRFDGYWKLPEKTGEAFREGYLSVGDMARRDEDGFYYLVDRKTDMINPGGENIYPSAVENLLGARPKVKDVAVIGRPDTKWGGLVHAVIVLRDYAIATEWEIPSGALTPIAGYKRPRSVRAPVDYAEDRHRKDPAPRPARPAFGAGVNWPLGWPVHLASGDQSRVGSRSCRCHGRGFRCAVGARRRHRWDLGRCHRLAGRCRGNGCELLGGRFLGNL